MLRRDWSSDVCSSDLEERESIEERFLTDADYFDCLCALESDIGSDHLSNRLPARDREAFEKAVLAVPSRARHVKELKMFSAALGRAQLHHVHDAAAASMSSSTSQPGGHAWLRAVIDLLTPSARRLAMIGSAVAVVLAAAIFLWPPISGPEPGDSTAEQPAVAPDVPSAVVVESWELSPGGTRTKLRQGNVFRRPTRMGQTELMTLVPDTAVTQVGATLRRANAESLPLQSEPAVTAHENGIAVRVRVSSQLLAPGDYVLSLTRQVNGVAPEPFATRRFTIDEN
jgi:hypothetical protein